MAEQPQKPLQTINVKNRPNCNGLKKIPLISLPLWVKKIEHNLFCKFSRWIRPHPWPTLLTELIDPYFDQFYRWIGPIWGKSLWDHLFVGLFTVFRCWIYVLKLACLHSRRLLLDQAKAKQTEILSIFAWPTFAKKCL